MSRKTNLSFSVENILKPKFKMPFGKYQTYEESIKKKNQKEDSQLSSVWTLDLSDQSFGINDYSLQKNSSEGRIMDKLAGKIFYANLNIVLSKDLSLHVRSVKNKKFDYNEKHSLHGINLFMD